MMFDESLKWLADTESNITIQVGHKTTILKIDGPEDFVCVELENESVELALVEAIDSAVLTLQNMPALRRQQELLEKERNGPST